MTAFSPWLARAPLSALVMEHDRLNRLVNLPGHWPADHEARMGAIWTEIGRRFPEYRAAQKRLAAYRAERERLIRAGESSKDADAILDRPLSEFMGSKRKAA